VKYMQLLVLRIWSASAIATEFYVHNASESVDLKCLLMSGMRPSFGLCGIIIRVQIEMFADVLNEIIIWLAWNHQWSSTLKSVRCRCPSAYHEGTQGCRDTGAGVPLHTMKAHRGVETEVQVSLCVP
jgi:hypothetical protein